MIQTRIPTSARYITPFQSFHAPFNEYSDGTYNFADTSLRNTNRRLMELQTNTVYLLQLLSIGSNIDEGKYLDSVVDVPRFVLSRQQKNEFIYREPISVVNFARGEDVTAFINVDFNDYLLITLNVGVLNQTIDLVGKEEIILFVKFSVWAIESTEYLRYYKDRPGEGAKAGIL